MNTTTLNMTTLDGGVIIKKGGATPTPPSGGESGVGIKLMYLDVEKVKLESAGLAIYTCLIRGIVNMGQEMKAVVTSPMFEYYGGHDGDAFAIMPDAKVAVAGRMMTIKESLQQMGVWDACVNAEITEAEFYNLD